MKRATATLGPRTRIPGLLGCLALVLSLVLTSCADDTTPTERADQRETPAAPATSPTTAPAPSGGPEPVDVEPPDPEDVRLMRTFVAFAVDPGPETAAAIPFASQVRLGLGTDVVAAVDVDEVAAPAAWDLEAGSFRGRTGTLSALELIASRAEDAGSSAIAGGPRAFSVSLGAHLHCASPPVPPPKRYAEARRVSLQPSQRLVDSCLSWFTVDLFLDGAGRIAAVTLDLWEP